MLIDTAVAYHCIDVMQNPLHVLPLLQCSDNFYHIPCKLAYFNKTYMITTYIYRYIVKTYMITCLCTIISFCFHVICTVMSFFCIYMILIVLLDHLKPYACH